MPDTRIFLGKVKGAVPEQFLLVEMYTDLSAIKRADFTTEARLRKTLRFNGMPDAEVNSLFENARQHQV